MMLQMPSGPGSNLREKLGHSVLGLFVLSLLDALAHSQVKLISKVIPRRNFLWSHLAGLVLTQDPGTALIPPLLFLRHITDVTFGLC